MFLAVKFKRNLLNLNDVCHNENTKFRQILKLKVNNETTNNRHKRTDVLLRREES